MRIVDEVMAFVFPRRRERFLDIDAGRQPELQFEPTSWPEPAMAAGIATRPALAARPRQTIGTMLAEPSTPPQLAPDRHWHIEVIDEEHFQLNLRLAAEATHNTYDGHPLVVVTLEPEPESPEDPHTIRIDCRRSTLGYLPKPLARDYHFALGAVRSTCTGLIYGTSGIDRQGNRVLAGLWLNAQWPPYFRD